jgi:hypothetical protein
MREWSGLHSLASIYPEKDPPPTGINLIGGWMGLNFDLDVMEKKENFVLPGMEFPVVRPTDYHYTIPTTKELKM